jgi:hypothetical protein
VDEKRFWDIISVGCPKQPGASWIVALRFQLLRLPIQEIDFFARVLDAKPRAACTFDLWAAFWLLDTSGDMEFLYFCNWLVGEGKLGFESVLQDPDRLADRLQQGDDFAADITWITSHACAQATGKPEDDFWIGKDDLLRATVLAEDVTCERWDYEDQAELRRRFPRLAAWMLDSEDEYE